MTAMALLSGARALQGADLSGLSPEQRRAVERMREQGVVPQQVVPVETPSVGPVPAGALLTLPDFAPVSRSGDIVALNLAAPAPGGSPARFVTFGQAFRAGDLSPAERPGLQIGNRVYPVQMDVKARHTDGTVRHAVLTADLEGLAAARLHRAMIVRGGPAPAIRHAGYRPLAAEIELTGRQADGTPLDGRWPVEGGDATAWLDGPLVKEMTTRRAVGPLLTLRTDHRLYADGSSHTRLTFENHKSFARGSRDLFYSASLHQPGLPSQSWQNVRHYRGSNWSALIEAGAPPWRVEHDPAYLAAARAILPYDLGYGVSQGRVQANLAALQARSGPLSPGLLTQYFPSTGGRGEIGPLPEWDVAFLKSQNADARAVMLRMADTAGAVPWHFEDDRTGQPVQVDDHPLFWADESGADEWRGVDRIPAEYFAGSDGGWTLDTAHKPLLSYTAYLVTGEAWYARELAHEAAFSIAKIWPELRENGAGVGEELQLRGRAWALRDVGAAAWLLPDEAPLKRYFVTTRDRSLSYMAGKYLLEGAMDAAGETEGWFEDPTYSVKGAVPPWQNDYMTIVLAQEALRGSQNAAALVRWTEHYQAGRFLDTGASAEFGAAYAHMVNHPGTQRPVGNWGEVVRLTVGDKAYLNNFPDYGAGYVTSAYAALVLIHRVTGSRRSLEAMHALAATQQGSRLFDPQNPTSIHALPQFLMAYPDTDSASASR